MSKKFPEYESLDLSRVNKEILQYWNKNGIFNKSLETRKDNEPFVFYEGPPSANGKPGIHHILARAIKDTFCRYKAQQGYYVERKAGWDTHGLPVEINVEKNLGIRKDDIGEKISIAEYNKACREDVMKYTDLWEDITEKMGYWIDMDNPYITYHNKYIESIWYLLKQLYEKGLLYKGLSIQPYSPAAGTGLSSHELNMPGCYKEIKDTSAITLFKAKRDENSEFLFKGHDTNVYFLAWTTTPWTLLSNTALAAAPKIIYVKVRTFNPYTAEPVTVIMAKELMHTLFPEKNKDISFDSYNGGAKVPYEVLDEFEGKNLEGIRYEQLLPYQQPKKGDAFKIVLGDFVSTEEGTGIVHIAPSFGADDKKVGDENGIGALTLVNKDGKFVDGVGEFSGRYIKNEYDPEATEDTDPVDVDIVVKLKNEGKLFKTEKYTHNYPHCWRTDKPILYYPIDAWFIRSTAKKDRMIELNDTINWQPEYTGSGRFKQWLEGLVDWNLSRSRYWGTPLPVWVNADESERKCIGSVAELKQEIDFAVDAGFMQQNLLADFVAGDNSEDNYSKFDLHRPFVDDIILVDSQGNKMHKETDLIDVWFDSGAMPYGQLHYPFENQDKFTDNFPADFIAEGVDQTRGWFFTLHAIATLVFDSVAYKNIVSNGLVLDKNGNKMSKKWGNVVDPFDTIEEDGSDPLRWYMLTNTPPWDNLKFDPEGLKEVKRKFFGTLYNTYSFFALYANIDGFDFSEDYIPVKERPEIDRWIISVLNTLVKNVTNHYEEYHPTKAGRAIHEFVIEHMSNWYVRLTRKRFWGGEMDKDKIAAYQTLYTCLETVAKLSAPIAPFYTDQLFLDLNKVSNRHSEESVHIAYFPKSDDNLIDKDLEDKMDIAQKISSMVLSLRRKENIKVRQPLNKILIPIISQDIKQKIEEVKDIILRETNIKHIEYITDTSGYLHKNIKPDFKKLGPKYGKMVKKIAAALQEMSNEEINRFEREGSYDLTVDNQNISLTIDDVSITSEDIPGWLVASDNRVTVALDITITEDLKQEGIAREFVNRIQNLRKNSGLEVTDNINLRIKKHGGINAAIEKHNDYISSQTLAKSIELVDDIESDGDCTSTETISDDIETVIQLEKV